jgi:autotransporter-associated beta strand protein
MQNANPTNGVVSVTTLGSCTVALNGTNSYTGTTTVSNGTLLVNGVIGTNNVTVVSGTLGGGGVIRGAVTVQSGGALAPGGSNIGTLTISNSLTLAGTTFIALDKSAATNDNVRGLTGVTYGGTLSLTNVSAALTTNDTFKIFYAASYNGALANLSPAIPAPGFAWNTNTLATDGTLRVIQTVSTAPVTMNTLVSANTLTLSWPADHTGWRLQVQTNGISTGLGTNWTDVAGATTTNQMSFPIDPTSGVIFYRIAFP